MGGQDFFELYDTYKGASRTIARDILSTLGTLRGFEHLSSPMEVGQTWLSRR